MKSFLLLPALLSVFLLGACRAVGAPGLPPEANRLQPDHAPTPYRAEEIRAACPEGRRDLYEMQSAGKAKVWQLSTFLLCDDSGAVFESVLLNEDGDRVGEPASANATWEELQAHASFPAAITDIRPVSCRVPAGRFDCWLYTVTERHGSRKLVQRFWFARSLPGPPIRVEQRENGKLLFEMKLVRWSDGDPARSDRPSHPPS